MSVLRELSAQFLECGICSGTFKEPRDLKCMHTFCVQCLTFLSEDQPKTSKQVVCPSCKVPTNIPDGGIATLPKNRFLESLLEKITSHTEKLLRNSCSQHEGRELALFCRKCDIAICHVCAVETHPSPQHVYVPLNTVVKEHREGCSEHMRNIADELVRDERNLKIAKRKSAILREKKDEVESQFHAVAEEVMQLIKIREQELGEELDCILETREDEIAIFCRALEKKLIDDRKSLTVLRDILDRGDDAAVSKKYGEIRQKKSVHKMPLAPDGLRFVIFKRDDDADAVGKENLGCLQEVMIPWNDGKNNVVENGIGGGGGGKHQQKGEGKSKKEKAEKEANEKGHNGKEGGHGGKIIKENNSGHGGRKVSMPLSPHVLFINDGKYIHVSL